MSSAEEFLNTFKWMENLHEDHVDLAKTVGPPTWRYLHTLAKFTPPDAGSQDAGFRTLKQVIATFPCRSCAEHGTQYLEEHPFEGNLEDYICGFHNVVNEHLGKPQHSCDLNLLSQEPETIIEGREEGQDDDINYEAVPYLSQDIGISIPLGPGVPSIDFAIGADEPLSVFPFPLKLINWLGDPWRQRLPRKQELKFPKPRLED